MTDYLKELPGVARGLEAQGETTDGGYVRWAKDEIEHLRAALTEIEECYVDKFGGQIQGIKDGIPLHRPCEIARKALQQ